MSPSPAPPSRRALPAPPAPPAPTTPRDRARHESARRGPRAFALACAALLTETLLDTALVETLGGAHGRALVDAGLPDDQGYWPRVWAARALDWAWHDCATDAVLSALADDHWRVREMALRVVGRHLTGMTAADRAGPLVAALTTDPHARVRARALRISVLPRP